MRIRSQRRNILGLCLVAAAVVILLGAIRHNENATREASLYNLGALVYFSHRFPKLNDALARSSNEFVAQNGPHFIDRLFGDIVVVDFGKRHDVSTVAPDKVVDQLVATDTLRVAMIDGLAIDDAQLARLGSLKHLRELGLRRTKVTADGVARLKQTRPELEVRMLP